MRSLLARFLTSFLAFAFVMAGLGKLHPSHPMHSQMLAKAPEWRRALGLSALPQITPHTLRVAIGAAEITFGLLLVVNYIAALPLTILMLGAVFTHYTLDGKQFTQESIPAAVLLALLSARLVLGNERPPAVPIKDE